MISDEKFGKREHLLKSADFRAVYKNGASSRRNSAILYCLPNKLCYNRIGFSISSRNVKNAVSRNAMRRKLREIFRHNKKNVKQGFDIVMVVKKEFARNTSYRAIEDLYLKLGKSAGI